LIFAVRCLLQYLVYKQRIDLLSVQEDLPVKRLTWQISILGTHRCVCFQQVIDSAFHKAFSLQAKNI